MNPVVLYLVRHGAIVSNGRKAFIGHTDVPLSEEGIAQARAVAQWLAPIPFTRTISSDLSRSRQTCEIIAGQHSGAVETVPALREIHLGDWESVSLQEIESRFPGEFAERGRDIENWRPPHGESFADCGVRVRKALNGIVSGSRGNVLLVAHAGVNRLILCSALGIPIKNLFQIGQDYGCVNVLEFAGDDVRVRLMNYRPELCRQDQPAPSPNRGEHGHLLLEYCL